MSHLSFPFGREGYNEMVRAGARAQGRGQLQAMAGVLLDRFIQEAERRGFGAEHLGSILENQAIGWRARLRVQELIRCRVELGRVPKSVFISWAEEDE